MKNTFYRGYQLTVAPYEVATETAKKWKVRIQIVHLAEGRSFENPERENFVSYVQAQEAGLRKAKSLVNDQGTAVASAAGA
jgi:hypothetical protein